MYKEVLHPQIARILYDASLALIGAIKHSANSKNETYNDYLFVSIFMLTITLQI